MEQQTKKGSLIEALVNTGIGFIITYVFGWVIYWAADVPLSNAKMGIVTLMFTVLSVIRNYFIRRWFAGGKIYTHGRKRKTHRGAAVE